MTKDSAAGLSWAGHQEGTVNVKVCESGFGMNKAPFTCRTQASRDT